MEHPIQPRVGEGNIDFGFEDNFELILVLKDAKAQTHKVSVPHLKSNPNVNPEMFENKTEEIMQNKKDSRNQRHGSPDQRGLQKAQQNEW